jgi:hypothetical protein
MQRPAAVYASLPMPARKRRFLALPYVGLHSFQQKEATAYSPGLRIGGLFGVRLGDRLSLGGEVTFDRSNVSGPAGSPQTWFFRTSVSPLIHLPAGSLEVALGPKLGIYTFTWRYNVAGASVETRDTGYSTGINAGAFTALSPQTSIGLLLSFDVMWSRPTCILDVGVHLQKCGDTTDVAKVLGLTGGVLF